ncbi:MAG: hypothetical protein HRT88_12205, partial [Lentisphaeraceae bacterium]|nr:hypothetical protein [Lentisphaeraceae bacterium]
MKKCLLIITALVSLIGCSHDIKIVKVTPENTNQLSGVRIFAPEPYLLLGEKPLIVNGIEHSEEKDGVRKTTVERVTVEKQMMASIVYLPNPQKEYCLTGIENMNQVKLVDGWRMEGFSVEGTLTSIQKKHLLEMVTGIELTPGMYRFVRDPSGSI